MALFSVGDVVKVRDDLETYQSHGNYLMTPPHPEDCGWAVIEPMTDFRGKFVTITEAGERYYHIAEDGGFFWTDEMFDLSSVETADDFDIDACEIAQYLG